jgi:hypothetical protein
MPFACLGLIGFRFVWSSWRHVIVPMVLLVAAISLAINLIGALQGSMLCDFPHFAAGLYLAQMLSGETRTYPLAPWLAAPFAIWIIFLGWSMSQRKRNKDFY